MSWDIFVQDWGNYKSLNEIPDDFKPHPIGKRQEIIEKIAEAEPTVDFSDPAWGRIDNEHFSLEINLGDSEILNGFALHVRGDEYVLGCIANILDKLDLKGADGGSPDFFDKEKYRKNLLEWIEYKNQILKK